jgi:nucleoside-diphosphate-sugar epimerase
MDNRSVFVMGGSGFIGINLVNRLLAEGYQVTVLDKAPPAKGEHRAYWTPVDILDAVQPRRGDRGGTADDRDPSRSASRYQRQTTRGVCYEYRRCG